MSVAERAPTAGHGPPHAPGCAPVLLIRALEGNEDEALNRAYAAAGPSARLRELPRGGHTGGLDAMPRAYERRVAGLFHDVLLGRGGRAG